MSPGECSVCNEALEDYVKCKKCRSYVCENCAFECKACGKMVCDPCSKQCTTCNELFCAKCYKKHVKICP